ncbi:MAG TPA: cupin domain-containing protein [Geobacteraceae bacterium]
MAKNSCDWEPENLKDSPCNWQPHVERFTGDNRSTLYKFSRTFSWQGVQREMFTKEGTDLADVVRHVIIGNKGEHCRFSLRYFELAPGVTTSSENHLHEHTIICIRGRGKALVGQETHALAPLDTLFISGGDPHQLCNEGSETFGFFCIVNTDEDHAVPILDDELQWLQEAAQGAAPGNAGDYNR